MSTVAHFFIIIVAQKFVITWLTFSLTFTLEQGKTIAQVLKDNTKLKDKYQGYKTR